MVIQTFTSMFADVFSKEYKRDLAKMTSDEVKKLRKDQRIKFYKLICFCGTGLITCMDKSALLNKLSVYDRAAASKCTLYFSFCLISMLLGVIASSFPESAPFALEVSWNGSLQAFLFAISCLHLSVMEYYADLQQMFVSFLLTSTLFSILWYFFTKESVNNKETDQSEQRSSK